MVPYIINYTILVTTYGWVVSRNAVARVILMYYSESGIIKGTLQCGGYNMLNVLSNASDNGGYDSKY
jgi:hypothetical protein